MVRSKAVYLASAVLPDGRRDILGIWTEQTEGTKFWMKVFTDQKTRGCEDILIAVTDGLKCMPEALDAMAAEPWPRSMPSRSPTATAFSGPRRRIVTRTTIKTPHTQNS